MSWTALSVLSVSVLGGRTLWQFKHAFRCHRRHACQSHAVLSLLNHSVTFMGQVPCLYVQPVSVLNAGTCGTSSTPGDDSEGILASHTQSCLYSTNQSCSWGRYHVCMCNLCLCSMQELVAPQARLEMTQKAYLPATCSLVSTQPISHVHGAGIMSVCATCVCAQCRSLWQLKDAWR